MRERKVRGVAIAQYAIILAIIVGVVVFAYGALGLNIADILKSFSDVLTDTNNKIPVNNSQTQPSDTGNNTTPKVGPLGGTAQTPVKQCANNICTMDFGEFVLNGLPGDFNEYVQGAGASGGTGIIADLIKQLAVQAQQDNKIADSEELLKLSTLGHNLAVMQKYGEDTVNSCSGSSACMLAEIKKTIELPAGYDESVAPFPGTSTYEQMNETMFDIGRARNYKTNDPDEYAVNLANNSLAYLFVDQYDYIMKNSTLTEATKGVLKELYWDIGTVNEDFDTNLNNVIWTGGGEYYDPLTGKQTNLEASTDPFGDFASYKASKITHFDSALMCGAGQNSDSGTQCH